MSAIPSAVPAAVEVPASSTVPIDLSAEQAAVGAGIHTTTVVDASSLVSRPDVTPAQVIGILTSGVPILANLAHAFGLFAISASEQAALKSTLAWGVVSAGALFGADALLRFGRNIATKL